MLSTRTTNDFSAFHALADSTRVRIVRLLVVSSGEACLCDLSSSLKEPNYKLSRHLKILRKAGLVAAEKEGRWIYHSAIKGDSSIAPLYQYVALMPDTSKLFSKDLARFQSLLKARKNQRCSSTPAPNLTRSPL
jgi:ArsR family transcriptional regulator